MGQYSVNGSFNLLTLLWLKNLIFIYWMVKIEHTPMFLLSRVLTQKVDLSNQLICLFVARIRQKMNALSKRYAVRYFTNLKDN